MYILKYIRYPANPGGWLAGWSEPAGIHKVRTDGLVQN